METILKIISGILILITLYMGFKQGWPMMNSHPEMLAMLGEWGIGKTTAMVLGILVMLAAVLILFPKTFLAGNVLTAMVIIVILASQLYQQDFQSALIELPFLIIPFVLIYLGHPFTG